MSRLMMAALGSVIMSATMAAESPLSGKMKGLDGKEINLADYKGKVVLVVNVASQCGYTSQYEGLQNLHVKFKDKGLVVLGVPCNQFGAQEPGSADEIQQFCKKNYGVSFPLTAKVDVNGDKACDLYKALTAKGGKFPGKVAWNFEKFLIGRDGQPVSRYKSGTGPDSEELVEAIEKALAAKA
jgi:glutathione peroxidase